MLVVMANFFFQQLSKIINKPICFIYSVANVPKNNYDWFANVPKNKYD